jgi:hypothetical protein
MFRASSSAYGSREEKVSVGRGGEGEGGRREGERGQTLSMDIESMILTTVEWMTNFLSINMYSGRSLL